MLTLLRKKEVCVIVFFYFFEMSTSTETSSTTLKLVPDPQKIPPAYELTREAALFGKFFVEWLETYPATRRYVNNKTTYDEWTMDGWFDQDFTQRPIEEYLLFLEHKTNKRYELESFGRYNPNHLEENRGKTIHREIIILLYLKKQE